MALYCWQNSRGGLLWYSGSPHRQSVILVYRCSSNSLTSTKKTEVRVHNMHRARTFRMLGSLFHFGASLVFQL